MIKKPDLRIDTEFFDDNLNGLIIPEAIRVTQSIDTQTFIKQGLNDEGIDNVTVLAIESIEKIVSQRLFDNFLACWRRLKQSDNTRFSLESTPYSQKGHKRPSLNRNRASRQEITIQISENRSTERHQLQLNQLRSDSHGDGLGWLNEQRKMIKNKSVVKGLSRKKSSAAETHLERAKVLKQIVDKLRQGRQSAKELFDQIDNHQENQQLHHKLNKLQRLMQDVHYSATQQVAAPERYSLHYSQSRDKKSDEIDSELSARLKQDLTQVKSQMLKIRRSNQQLLRDEQWRKAQITRIASVRQQTKEEYEALRYQIQHLKQDKKIDELNNLRLQNELSFNYTYRQDFQRQISFLAQRVNQSEQRAQMLAIHRSTERPIIPVQTNPFGYSTFATSQKNSQALVNSWEQSSRPVGAKPRPHQPNQQAREAADEWSCC